MMLIAYGLERVAATKFEGRRAYLLARHMVIPTDQRLRERELRKRSALSDAIRQGFRDRGFDTLRALRSISADSADLHRV